MKIFISGAVSSRDYEQAVRQFAEKEKYLTQQGHTVYNPTKEIPSHTSWTDSMRICLQALVHCDAIYLLNGWSGSKGANIEFRVAFDLGLDIITEHLIEPPKPTHLLHLQFPMRAIAKQSVRLGKKIAYQPKKLIAYTESLKAIARYQMTDHTLISNHTPIYAEVEFYFKIKDKKLHGLPKTSTPDTDNLCKGIFDALQGVVYENDSAIYSFTATKYYSDKDEILITFRW